mmetsp:Transcript_48908/g.81183  ORF Transcript_48908/g.81183 Transcript_48908/m.81183 type:complete len:272 (+) Transcript_48908:35-850(+)
MALEKENKSLKLAGFNFAFTKSCPSNWDSFFVALVKEYRARNGGIKKEPVSFNPRRVTFISVYGLFQTWRQCPPTSLYNAIFILPVKKKWIEAPFKYGHQYSDLLQNQEFNHLLRWKLSQRLLFCACDTEDVNLQVNDAYMVATLWHQVSARLQELYDPIRQRRYDPLFLDEHHWLAHTPLPHRSFSRYEVNAEDIINELYFAQLKYKCVQRILVESNPTLRAITHFQVEQHVDRNSIVYTPLSSSADATRRNQQNEGSKGNRDFVFVDEY